VTSRGSKCRPSPNRLPWYGLTEFSVDLKPSMRAEPIPARCSLVIALRATKNENPLHGKPNDLSRLPNFPQSSDLIIVNTIWLGQLFAGARARSTYINGALLDIASDAYSQRGRPG
jgi:hypothetical protein